MIAIVLPAHNEAAHLVPTPGGNVGIARSAGARHARAPGGFGTLLARLEADVHASSVPTAP